MKVRELMQVAPVIPVLVIDDLSHAVPLAESLVAGGLPVLEVTLRTPLALDAMEAMAKVEGAIVGVGTAVSGDDLKKAQDRGAQFAVSPGYTESLGSVARSIDLPLLPGIMTPADIMRAMDGGYRELKFFPASQAGGPKLLKAFGGPFTEVVFCPTGGINADTAKDYLALKNVVCVGGSWVAPKALLESGDWSGITELASKCTELQ